MLISPYVGWVAGAPSNDSSLPARDNSSHAGDGSAPAFDIFATFSFPPFMTFGRPQADIPDGTYIIRFVPPGGSTGNKTFLALDTQGPNPAVDPLAVTVDSPKDQVRFSSSGDCLQSLTRSAVEDFPGTWHGYVRN